jgi:hypothetical protein
MLNPSGRTARVLRYLLEGIVAICTAYASIALFTWALGQLAMARFWEPWVTRFGVLGSEVPFVFVALSSGFAIGAAVGLVYGRRALHIAALSGVLAAVVWLVAPYPNGGSMLWSSIVAAATLAVGLIMGSICTRRIRHA